MRSSAVVFVALICFCNSGYANPSLLTYYNIVTTYTEEPAWTVQTPITYPAGLVTETYDSTTSTITEEAASTDSSGYVISAIVETETEEAAVPTAAPAGASTVIQTYGADYPTVVNVLLPAGAGNVAQPTVLATGNVAQPTALATGNVAQPTALATGYGNNYYVQLTYTADSSCPTPWTFTTQAAVYVVSGISPSVTATSFSTFNPYGESDEHTTETLQYVAATAVPTDELTALSEEYAPFWTTECTIPASPTQSYNPYNTDGYENPTYNTYGYPTATYTEFVPGPTDVANAGEQWANCNPFTETFAGKAVGGGYNCFGVTYYTHGISLPAIICAFIFSWFGLILILGLLQSFYSYHSLVHGRSALRGLPFLFAFILPPISFILFIACGTGFTSKPAEERPPLAERWAALAFGAKLKEWLKWGFRQKYPPFLGAPAMMRNRKRIPPATRQYQWQPSPGPGVAFPPMGEGAGGQPQYAQMAQHPAAGSYAPPLPPRPRRQQRQSNHPTASGALPPSSQDGAGGPVQPAAAEAGPSGTRRERKKKMEGKYPVPPEREAPSVPVPESEAPSVPILERSAPVLPPISTVTEPEGSEGEEAGGSE